jgi:hypothetical protein
MYTMVRHLCVVLGSRIREVATRNLGAVIDRGSPRTRHQLLSAMQAPTRAWL